MLHDELLESISLHQLLPSSLAPWRPLLADGMTFFLGHLPAHRQEEILAHQLALPARADAPIRLATLLVQCPTLHKLGQVLARNRQLPEEIRHQLQKLESMPPTTPMESVLTRLHDELSDDPPVDVAQDALAEGSVAVIVPFTYRENGQVRDGVFKVLKPGIEEKFDDEIAVWGALGTFLEERGRNLGLPALDYRHTLDSVRELLTNEIHLRVEQHNMRAARAFYAHDPRILVPRLLPWCTPRVTAMERIFGVKVTDARLSRLRRADLASTLVSSLVGQPFWSVAQSAMFHADLHAGNLFATDDGRLAVLDWSLTLRLSKADRGLLVSIILGGLTLDGERICKAVAALGTIAADDPILERAVERALDRVAFQGRFPGFDWVLDFLDELALETATGFREDFVLFRKTWFSLSDVIGDMVGAYSPDIPLLMAGLTRFIAELPERLFARPESTCYSTHLSNADMMQASASACLIPGRYWARCWQGLVPREFSPE
ncbi:AarF/UbiB family protein [Herbaspirillum sp. ST 5-3]|uniref:AarF/UbiB family protein n=1 Tax=Oxalobacteraceae TaxID=75682 RepID=UPI0010A3A5A2|nr:AarF/UbiB family protein [Herbaspirillum sp. ST 5-3]